MATNTLSPNDAQHLIHMAEAAPLLNMREAVAAQGVLQRAAEHFNAHFGLPTAPAGTLGTPNAAGVAASATQDPTDLPAAGSPSLAQET